ncbi:MAG: methyltransferase domain-containing protein [Coxiellaceae bacterium]|nr:methyltransferase domain-containing protein [Coxiellaceae bacterium]MDF1865530.1 methyltransferase domain-containing protein [Saprospiraceae bacterium]
MAKFSKYQDYVIKDGALIGEFEEMYKEFDDPWEQLTRERFSSEKAIAINWCHLLQATCNRRIRVVELGCGLGAFTSKLASQGFDVLGIDVSRTAIEKARSLQTQGMFEVGDINDFDIYHKFKPDVFILAEITWYVLDKLSNFIKHTKKNFPGAHLVHLLNVYSGREQKYGNEYFSNAEEIIRFFTKHGADVIECGENMSYLAKNRNRTYFLSKL